MSKKYMDLQIDKSDVEIISLEEADIREARGAVYNYKMNLGGYVIYEHRKTGLFLLMAKLFNKPDVEGYIAIPEMAQEEYDEYMKAKQKRESEERERLKEERIREQIEYDRLEEERDFDLLIMAAMEDEEY